MCIFFTATFEGRMWSLFEFLSAKSIHSCK
jgi:hypothetical protein